MMTKAPRPNTAAKLPPAPTLNAPELGALVLVWAGADEVVMDVLLLVELFVELAVLLELDELELELELFAVVLEALDEPEVEAEMVPDPPVMLKGGE
jgi:hypothetical protein